VRIASEHSHALELSVVGYQFPEAENLAKRYSWHMIEGKAIDADVSWHFRWQALTCGESHRVAPWLRLLAERVASPTKGPEAPARLAFTEPNLAFVALEVDADRALLRVELDLEFHRDRAHWQAGDPYLLDLVVTEATLMQAATQWEAELRAYSGR
jgi:hypothetical protein